MGDSPVSGIAGSARILKLTPHLLRKMERHGKREDETGKARVINDEPPLTTTGLDLEALYLAHVDGVYIPKAKSVAIELLLQFPADLVDGEDPEYLLKHTRAFAETVWGSEAVFADRVDRDEKGRENVSVYVTPKYVKKTPHTEKVAVSMTRDLKRLAEKYGRKEHKWDIGRALQDAAFDYFKDIMELEGVQRGHGKVRAGKDWESAERLREKELNSIREALEAERREVEAVRKDADIKQEQADRALLAAAALEKRNLELNIAVEAELARIKQDREMQQAAAAAINAEIESAKAEAAAHLRAVAETARAAVLDRKRAEAERAVATAGRVAIEAEKLQIAADQRLHISQLELLARASDDRNGLNLRQSGEGFAIYRERLTAPEQETFASAWPPAIVAIARSIARALEQARDLLQRLKIREKDVEEREKVTNNAAARLKRDQDAHQASVTAHQTALRNLNLRLDKLQADEAGIAEKTRAADAAIKSAKTQQRDAQAATQRNDDWADAINAITPFAGRVSVGTDCILVLDEAVRKFLPHPVATLMGEPAPTWVTKLVVALEKQANAAETQQGIAAASNSADRNRIDRSRSILEAVVSNQCVAAVKNGELHLTYLEDGKPERIEQIPFADVEASVISVAQLRAKLIDGGARIGKLEQELRNERTVLAERYPERAPALREEQKAVEQKIQRAFNPGQIPPAGMGF
jgi:hypothetical protein